MSISGRNEVANYYDEVGASNVHKVGTFAATTQVVLVAAPGAGFAVRLKSFWIEILTNATTAPAAHNIVLESGTADIFAIKIPLVTGTVVQTPWITFPGEGKVLTENAILGLTPSTEPTNDDDYACLITYDVVAV